MRVLLRTVAPFIVGTEIGMAILYLFAAINSEIVLTYFEKDFLSKLYLIMVLEFVMAHSGVFFSVILGAMRKVGNTPKVFQSKLNIEKKYQGLIIFSLYGIYLLFAVAFAGWYGLIVYTTLSISRCYYIFFGKEFHFAAEVGKSMSRAGIYLLSLVFLVVTELEIGTYNPELNISMMGGDITPLMGLNWGFIYFSLIAISSFLIDRVVYRK